jgi:hypothetical protein
VPLDGRESEAHPGLQRGTAMATYDELSATERTSSRIVGNPSVILGLRPQRPGHVLTFGEFGYLKDFFLLFPFWMFLIYMRGVLAEFSPGSLVDPVQPVTHQAS